MSDLKTKYEIEISRTGNGAAEASADFKAVQAAAAGANASLAATTAGSVAVNSSMTMSRQTVTGTAAAFKILQPTLTLIGMQSFPQLASAGMLVKSALDAVRSSGVALNLNLATVSAGVAGLIALLVSAKFAWDAYQAQEEETLSKGRLDEQAIAMAETLRAQLQGLREASQITADEFERLSRLAGSVAGNQQIRDFLNNQNKPTLQSKLSEIDFMQEFVWNQMLLKDANLLNDSKAVRERMDLRYHVIVRELNELLRDGVITQKQFDMASMQAKNEQLKGYLSLKDKMTELQALGRSVGQVFATQLSSAIVNVFKDGAQALREFASQFFATVAQMIMQLLIMRALKSAFNMNFAAAGGFFPVAPRMMAAGGMAGVSTVSSATYFPRHNVVAGEAGAEVMTVLARPRFMQLGGMQAMVGMAGGNKLAITDADQLAAAGNRGAGGAVQINVSLEPGLRADIVQDSVKNAVVQVTQDMSRDSKLSRTTKQLR